MTQERFSREPAGAPGAEVADLGGPSGETRPESGAGARTEVGDLGYKGTEVGDLGYKGTEVGDLEPFPVGGNRVLARHPRESGDPGATARRVPWIPAFAGMTTTDPVQSEYALSHEGTEVGDLGYKAAAPRALAA